VENAAHTGGACLREGAASVVFGFAGVNDHRPACFGGKSDLRGEGRQLRFTGRIIVVIVEAALADRDGAVPQVTAQRRYVSRRVERVGVVRMDSRRAENEARTVCGEAGGDPSCRE
jgi:hypothetical protein